MTTTRLLQTAGITAVGLSLLLVLVVTVLRLAALPLAAAALALDAAADYAARPLTTPIPHPGGTR